MAKTEKSKAELYREERKQRLSNAAKKNARKNKMNPAIGSVIGRVIGIILIVAIVCGAVWGVLSITGATARMQTAFTVGSHKISVAEYGYMYYMQFQNTASKAQQSEQQYGYNMYGFDYTKLPEEQDSPYTDDDGNPIKWDKQLEENTVKYMQEFYTLYDNAVAAGYKITDDEKADIDEQIESMRETASGKNSTQSNTLSLSLNSYLKLAYGAGITEGFMRGLMEKEMIVQRFSEDKQQEFKDKYTDEKLDEEYKKDTTAYDAVDLRLYKFETETLSPKEGESEEDLQKRQDKENAEVLNKAKAMLKDVTDEASFIEAAEVYIHEEEGTDDAAAETDDKAEAEEAEKTEDAAEAEDAEAAEEAEDAEAEEEHNHDSETKAYGQTKSSITGISEDAGKWAFAADRKAGDKNAFADASGNAYAVYVVKTAYPQQIVDVRHILFMTMDDQQQPLSDEEIAEKKKSAQDLLDQWNAMPEDQKTEEAFADLATEKTEDTGSSSTGGLYEKVKPGQMVDSFDKWIFDENRKEGDVDLIESEYGYHVMYYVGNKDYAYRDSLRTTHTQDDYSSWLEEQLAKDSSKITKNDNGMAKGYERASKRIADAVKSLSSSSNGSY